MPPGLLMAPACRWTGRKCAEFRESVCTIHPCQLPEPIHAGLVAQGLPLLLLLREPVLIERRTVAIGPGRIKARSQRIQRMTETLSDSFQAVEHAHHRQHMAGVSTLSSPSIEDALFLETLPHRA